MAPPDWSKDEQQRDKSKQDPKSLNALEVFGFRPGEILPGDQWEVMHERIRKQFKLLQRIVAIVWRHEPEAMP